MKQVKNNTPRNPVMEFWSRVALTANDELCWEWQGYLLSTGYGLFHWRYGRHLAHRYSWLLTYGKPPTLNILHKCDNPPCVNPKHLHEGTQKDNADDMVARGRSLRGTRHNLAKLNETDVLTIRAQANTASLSVLAAQFGISKTTIHDIINRKRWRHI